MFQDGCPSLEEICHNYISATGRSYLGIRSLSYPRDGPILHIYKEVRIIGVYAQLLSAEPVGGLAHTGKVTTKNFLWVPRKGYSPQTTGHETGDEKEEVVVVGNRSRSDGGTHQQNEYDPPGKLTVAPLATLSRVLGAEFQLFLGFLAARGKEALYLIVEFFTGLYGDIPVKLLLHAHSLDLG